MKRASSIVLALTALTALAAGGCSTTPAATSSTLVGSIAQASFPKAVSAITVKSSSGKTSTVAIAADGKFSVKLDKGAKYQLFLGPDGKSIPLVLKSGQGRLETQVNVRSGGASLAMGSVRYWGGGGTTMAKVIAGSGASSTACVNGVFANSTQPCASSVATAVCSDDGEENDDGEQGADTGEQGADCVDGIDAATKQPCDGGPAANETDADPEQEMGVPENDVSGDVGCGGDEEDDGESAD
jgi:hypothetical protein